MSNLLSLLGKMWIFVATLVSFVIFLFMNGGVVIGLFLLLVHDLGDRSAHAPTVNFGQFFYFLAFTCFFVSLDLPAVPKRLLRFWAEVSRNIVFVVLSSVTCLAAIHFYR